MPNPLDEFFRREQERANRATEAERITRERAEEELRRRRAEQELADFVGQSNDQGDVVGETSETTQREPGRFDDPNQGAPDFGDFVFQTPSGRGGFGGALTAALQNDPRLLELIEARLGGLSGPDDGGQIFNDEQLAAIRESEQLQADERFEQGRAQLLEDLFGRGVQRSTLAQDDAGRLLEGQARVDAEIAARHAGREISLRQDARNFLLTQATTIGDLLARDRATSAQVSVAGIGAQAQVSSAEIAAAAQNNATAARLRLGILEDSTRRALGFGDLSLREQALLTNTELTREEFGLRRELAEIAADATVRAAEAERPTLLDRILGGVGAVFSSREYKRDIAEDETFQEEVVEALLDMPIKGYRYNWDDKRYLGTILEEAHSYFRDPRNPRAVDLNSLIFALVAAVQFLSRSLEEVREIQYA